MAKKLVFLLGMVLLTLIVGCGRNRRGIEENEGYDEFAHFDEVRQLTISAPFARRHFIESAAERTRVELAQRGIGLHLEFSYYAADERDMYMAQMLAAMAHGNGSNVFYSDFDLLPYIDLGLFADVFSLMEQDPFGSRADYFKMS